MKDEEELEIVDVYDECMNKTGKATRAEAHEKSLLHMSVRVWLVQGGKLVFQRRSFGKKLFPGRLDPAVTGHVLSGETPQGSAVLEILEETGVRADVSDLYCAGAMPFRFLRPDGKTDNEFAVLFVWKPGPVDLKITPEAAGWIAMEPWEYARVLGGCGRAECESWPDGAKGLASRAMFCCPDEKEWAQVRAVLNRIGYK